jgi:hypothetical protein
LKNSSTQTIPAAGASPKLLNEINTPSAIGLKRTADSVHDDAQR